MLYDPKVQVNDPDFEKEIREFEKEPIEKGKIMFYGDSNFTRWKKQYGNVNLEDVILGKDGSKVAINHGFGGSTAEQQLYYYDRAVKPWAPRALVLSTFANDAGKGYTATEIFFLQARLMAYARTDIPGIKFFLCNTKPNLTTAGRGLVRKVTMAEYNELCADYCLKHDDAYLINRHDWAELYDKPENVGDYEHVRKDLFIEDNTHFNPEGYGLYTKFFIKELDSIL